MKNTKEEIILCKYKNEYLKGIGITTVPIKAEKLLGELFKELNLYIHKKSTIIGEELKGKEARWVITNKDTGLYLVEEKTRTKTLKAILQLINSHGITKFKEIIKEEVNEA